MKTFMTLLVVILSLSFTSCTENQTEPVKYFTISNEIITETNYYLFIQIDTDLVSNKESMILLMDEFIKAAKKNHPTQLNIIIHFSSARIMTLEEMSRDKNTQIVYVNLFGDAEKIGVVGDNGIMYYEI
jgi:hypothetical protein